MVFTHLRKAFCITTLSGTDHGIDIMLMEVIIKPPIDFSVYDLY